VAIYRFYYLDARDRVAAAEVFHCDNDIDAQARADRLLTGSIHPGIEVWDRIQVVYRAQVCCTARLSALASARPAAPATRRRTR
jgi:hypothetical protein